MLKLRKLQEQKQQQKNNKIDANFSGCLLSPARLRLQNDLDNLQLPPKTSITIICPLSNKQEQPLVQVVLSPGEGFYKGGAFTFNLEFTEEYPIEPPSVVCLNRIFHPNIDIKGRICLNILREDWSPVLDLNSIIVGLLFLFFECTPKDPLNKDAAQLLEMDSNMFANVVKITMQGGLESGILYDRVI